MENNYQKYLDFCLNNMFIVYLKGWCVILELTSPPMPHRKFTYEEFIDYINMDKEFSQKFNNN